MDARSTPAEGLPAAPPTLGDVAPRSELIACITVMSKLLSGCDHVIGYAARRAELARAERILAAEDRLARMAPATSVAMHAIAEGLAILGTVRR